MSTIRLSAGQGAIYKYLRPANDVRYATMCASRGFGKSFCASSVASRGVDYLVSLPADIPNKNLSIIAPTYSQAVDIYYPLLAHVFKLEQFAVKSSRAEGIFLFPNNVTLKLWSYEAIERMRGTGQWMVILDEVTTWTGKPGLKDAWESIIQPTMVTRWPGNHRGLIISTPMGYDNFHDLCQLPAIDPRWKHFHYSYRDCKRIDPAEVEKAKLSMDPIKFKREYEASFEDTGANVFYCFDRKYNLDPTAPDFQEGEFVHISIDFNVGIMAATVWAIRNNQMFAIGELEGAPDTQTLAKQIKAKYGKHKIYAYPDPSGKARKTSAPVGVTDFTILQAAGINVCSRSSHPPIVDSVAAVNRMLADAAGNHNMFVCPRRAPKTLKSLERTKWVESNPNLATIDKTEGVEHYSDGVRYITEFLYPVRGSTAVSKGFMF